MMKRNPLFLLLLALMAGCDAPQRTRAPVNYVSGSTYETGGSNPGTLLPGSVPEGGTTTTTITTNGTTSTSPGFETCDLSPKYHTIDVGLFGICQSTQDETLFKFKPTLSSEMIRVCLIPTYKDSTGASTYIGNPQCTLTTSQQVVQGRLYKDRPGFSSYPLNGVIVMKEPLLPEYIGCMQGYVNYPKNACPNGASNAYCAYWMPRCPYGAQSNTNCDVEARNYMAKICTDFKTKYANSYLDIRTKQ
jgi:hypothetical protein